MCDIHSDTPKYDLSVSSNNSTQPPGPAPPLAGPVPRQPFFLCHAAPPCVHAHGSVSALTLCLLYHQSPCHNKVYFTRKSLFPHILLVFNRFVTVPFQTFYADFTLVISNHVTRPAPPSPHARYRPKRGTPRCRCTPPHGCPHNASQNPSSCSPPVLFCREPACTGRFPLPVAPCDCIIAHAASHKSDFQGFSGDFCTKNAPPSQKWEGGALQVRLFSGAQWAAAYSGTTRPGCGAFSSRDFS